MQSSIIIPLNHLPARLNKPTFQPDCNLHPLHNNWTRLNVQYSSLKQQKFVELPAAELRENFNDDPFFLLESWKHWIVLWQFGKFGKRSNQLSAWLTHNFQTWIHSKLNPRPQCYKREPRNSIQLHSFRKYETNLTAVVSSPAAGPQLVLSLGNWTAWTNCVAATQEKSRAHK